MEPTKSTTGQVERLLQKLCKYPPPIVRDAILNCKDPELDDLASLFANRRSKSCTVFSRGDEPTVANLSERPSSNIDDLDDNRSAARSSPSPSSSSASENSLFGNSHCHSSPSVISSGDSTGDSLSTQPAPEASRSGKGKGNKSDADRYRELINKYQEALIRLATSKFRNDPSDIRACHLGAEGVSEVKLFYKILAIICRLSLTIDYLEELESLFPDLEQNPVDKICNTSKTQRFGCDGLSIVKFSQQQSQDAKLQALIAKAVSSGLRDIALIRFALLHCYEPAFYPLALRFSTHNRKAIETLQEHQDDLNNDEHSRQQLEASNVLIVGILKRYHGKLAARMLKKC